MGCERVGDERHQAEMMDVLYGEADVEVRARIEAHLSGCDTCRDEMTALAGVRRGLGAWTLPALARPALTARGVLLPRWLAAAALLLLGLGLALGAGGYVSLRRALLDQERRAAALEREHREAVQTVERALAGRTAASPASTAQGGRHLSDVDARIDERVRASEARQLEQIDLRLADWQERVEAQRRLDMARVAAGLSYLDGRHGQQLARTNELMGYVLETSAQKR